MGPLSDELLARIVALAADAIICINARQIITFFNDGASRIFGYDHDEIMGQPLSRLIPSRFRDAHGHKIHSFGESPVAARQMGDRSLISGLRKNGEEFPAEAAIAKMIGPNGPIFSVVLRDVTEQRRVSAHNEQLLAKTEAAVRARDEVLALVSHDLRNPVNAVKMLAGAIVRTHHDDNSVPVAVFEHATVMLQAANQMDALIQDLLDVTRLESGRINLGLQHVSLAEIAEEVVDTLRPMADEIHVVLEIDIHKSLPQLNVDPDRIQQLFSNLVGNAIKFSKPNGVVRITAFLLDHHVTVQVVDAGIGISADDLPFAFDRFWQSKRTNRSGAGLGLAIARGIVQAHGGDIRIESKFGSGTTVEFTLPI